MLTTTALFSTLVALAPSGVQGQRFVGTAGALPVSDPVPFDPSGLFQSTFVQVGDDMFIAGQPTERGLRDMKARGVTTVVNLRSPEEMRTTVSFDEPALVKELGMNYVYLPVRGNAELPYSPATLAKFAETMRGSHAKVLLHCTVAWRASHLWAAYLIQERGVSVGNALANARLINLMDEHHTGSGPQPVEEFLGRRLSELKMK